MNQFLIGALFIIAIFVGSALGANTLLNLLADSEKECTQNKHCGKNAYCSSDFSCHTFPNQPTDYTTPALLIAIGIIVAAYIYRH